MTTTALTPAQARKAKIAGLVAVGYTKQAATALVDSAPTTAPAKSGKKAQATSKEQADVLVEAGGYAHARGRVYVNGPIVEAVTRVLKGGKPEIVQTSGVGRTTAVVIFREESGDVAIQNLYTPN